VQLDQLGAVVFDHLGREHTVAEVACNVTLGAGQRDFVHLHKREKRRN
jgi:hypothetical protein